MWNVLGTPETSAARRSGYPVWGVLPGAGAGAPWEEAGVLSPLLAPLKQGSAEVFLSVLHKDALGDLEFTRKLQQCPEKIFSLYP